MNRLLASAALAVALAAGSVAAQSRDPPDPAKYPSLATLFVWLKGSTKEARNCAITVAMTQAARAAYEKSKSDAQATDTVARGLIASSKGQLDATRANVLAAGYVRTAHQFMSLPAEAAGTAIAALCRSAIERGDRPFGNPELVGRLVGEARACTSSGFSDRSTSYVPLECVVNAMSKR